MENEILPSSSGCYDIGPCGTRLGKRISRPVDLPEFSWPPESRFKENDLFLGTTTEENTRESTINQSKCAKMVAHADHFQGYQFNYQNVEGSKLTSYRKSQANEVEKINHYPLPVQLQSTQHEHPHWKCDAPTGKLPELLDCISKRSDMLSQADTGKSGVSYAEKSQFHPSQGDLVSGNPVVASSMALEMHNVSSVFVRNVGAVEQNVCQVDTSYAFSDGRGCPQEANRFGNCCVLDQSRQFLNSTGSDNPSSRDILSSGVSASTEQKVDGRSLHNEVQSSIVSFDNRVDNLLETRGRSHTESDRKMKDPEAMDKENIKGSLTDGISSKDGHRRSDGVQHIKSNKSNCSSHRLYERSRLPPSRMPLSAEKLWDGSLQLNSSITVSVVAFFKSGEKLLDCEWPELVEVKGKVRLDAFEKYIQDLPRSRNRGLTVISLCFKEGSSEKGLKGMKEVAKGYIKGERVGKVDISPGVYLYLCPRSDAIITILAKYGFFKGTAAVEGNSELMIGCVVWRKNQTASAYVAKISEEKANSLPEHLQKSPSDSSTLQAGGQRSSPVPSVPLNSSSALEKSDVDAKNVGIDTSSRITLTTSVVKCSPFQQQDTGLSSSQFYGSKGHLSSSEASCVHQSSAEPPKESTDLPKAATSLLSNASKPKRVLSDDDDLPEFDFGTPSGMSSNSHCSDRSILDNRLQHSGSRILDMSKQPTIPLAPSSMSIPRSVSSVSQDRALAGNFGGHGPLVTVSRQMEEKHKSQSHAIQVAVTVSTSGSPMVTFDNLGKKSMFCDDDMPEWLPPDARNEKTNEPAVTFPPESSNSTSRKLTPFPTGPVFPYPSSAAAHNGFTSQPSPPPYHLPANSKVPPPIPCQYGPSYSTGFTFNPVPRRKTGSLAAESSLQPADKRARRS